MSSLTTEEFDISSFKIIYSNEFIRISLLANDKEKHKILAYVYLDKFENESLKTVFRKIKDQHQPIGKTLIGEGYEIQKKLHLDTRIKSPLLVRKYLKTEICRNRVYSLFALKDDNQHYIGYISEFIKD